MAMNQRNILQTLGVMASVACWISLGVIWVCQYVRVGANIIQVCGALG